MSTIYVVSKLIDKLLLIYMAPDFSYMGSVDNGINEDHQKHQGDKVGVGWHS
jgi:hypothetical protein